MAAILEAIKSWFIDGVHKHGEGEVIKTESPRIIITRDSDDDEDSRPSTFVNSNYISMNPHLLESGNDKYTAANVVTMPNPIGNTTTKYDSSSKDGLQVSEETSVIRKLKKKRTNSGRGRGAGRR
ncbi:MAG: hypothetical protein RLN62_06880 [Rickettsiales bacterium]